MTGLIVPGQRRVSVRQEGLRVMVIDEDGRALLDMPWEAALELVKAITSQAKKAEEIAKADQVIEDAAILMRSGAPFGLTNNRQILKVAQNEAAWGMPRRYMRDNYRGMIFAPVVGRVKKPGNGES